MSPRKKIGPEPGKLGGSLWGYTRFRIDVSQIAIVQLIQYFMEWGGLRITPHDCLFRFGHEKLINKH